MGGTLVVKRGVLTENQYRHLHRWVTRKLGRPKQCTECNTTDAVFHWANISQEYMKDLSDWRRLCAKCHRKYDTDRKLYCTHGHERSPQNTNIRPDGRKYCRECDLIRKRIAYVNRTK